MSAPQSELLEALAARCEKERPSFALEFAIGEAIGAHNTPPRSYTVSIDTAATLVPDKFGWWARYLPHAMAYASVWAGWLGDTTKGDAKTPALALCAAALRARAALAGNVQASNTRSKGTPS